MDSRQSLINDSLLMYLIINIGNKLNLFNAAVGVQCMKPQPRGGKSTLIVY